MQPLAALVGEGDGLARSGLGIREVAPHGEALGEHGEQQRLEVQPSAVFVGDL